MIKIEVLKAVPTPEAFCSGGVRNTVKPAVNFSDGPHFGTGVESRESKPVPEIFFDPIYQQCLALAKQSKGTKQRYGSILINPQGEIIGTGYNRAISHRSFGRLERVIRQGYANHSEIEAINSALMGGHDVTNAVLYVAGYFPQEANRLYLKEHFTCTRCAPIIARQNIAHINVPTLSGWKAVTPEQALQEAQAYKYSQETSTHEKRLASAEGQYTLEMLELLAAEQTT